MATQQQSFISLESLNILQGLQVDGTVENNHRRIRRGVLRDSSDDQTWDEEVILPLYVNSIEALRFIGLKKDSARQVLQAFNSEYYVHGHPSTSLHPYDLIEFATGHLEGKPDAVTSEDDWLTVLKGLGVRRSLREAICDPLYDHIRFTKSAKEWAQETFDDSWAFLTTADHKIKSQRARLENNVRTRRGQQATQVPQAGHLDPQQIPSGSIPIVAEAEDIPQLPSNKVLLYKGGATDRLKNFVRTNGTLNPQGIVSTPPGDFARQKYIWYFSKQKSVAWDYAQYAKNRNPAIECGMVILAVPKELLQNPYEVRGDEWRTLVWSSRGPNYDEEEIAVQESYSQHALLLGPCCHMGDAGIARLNDKSELLQMQTGTGEKAEQWVIMQAALMARICDAAKDNVWLQVSHKKVEST